MKWSDCVGRHFRFDGCVYECCGWDSRPDGIGMLMVLIEKPEGGGTLFPKRNLGHETWVSERAINRTYHIVHWE